MKFTYTRNESDPVGGSTRRIPTPGLHKAKIVWVQEKESIGEKTRGHKMFEVTFDVGAGCEIRDWYFIDYKPLAWKLSKLIHDISGKDYKDGEVLEIDEDTLLHKTVAINIQHRADGKVWVRNTQPLAPSDMDASLDVEDKRADDIPF